MPAIEMVVVQPTPFCNIDCTYCYLPDRRSRQVIDLSTVTALFSKLFESGWACPRVTVVWHAGEPLVVPVATYRQAFEAIEAMRPASVEIVQAFQTNGMLLTPEWCAFLKEWNVGVGVSIDGPKDLHDARRKTRSGEGTFDRTLAGIRLLRAHDVPFHVITVLTAESLGRPRDLLDFYLAEGVSEVCFNVEESEGQHVSTLMAADDARERFRHFLETFWRLARESGKIRFVREIDCVIPRVFRPNGLEMRNAQVEPLAMLNVDCRGKVSSFSPELLGYTNPDYGDFVLGDINHDSLPEILDACLRSPLYRDISRGVEACKAECEYFSVCGGGAPINKLSENGRFDSTRTVFCSLTQMAATDIVLDGFDRLEAAWTDGAGNATA